MIAEILHKVAGMAKEDRQAYRPRPSNAGPERCIRQMVYHAREIPEDRGMADRFVVVLDDSSVHETLTEDWLNKSGYTLHSQQMKVICLTLEFAGRTFVMEGSIDGILTDLLGKDTHYEHKALNYFTFNRYWEGDTPWDYIVQCVLYQIGLRKLVPEIRQSLLLIKDKNTSAYIDYLIEYDDKTDVAGIKEICHSNGRIRTPDGDNPYLITLPGVVAGVVERFTAIDQHVHEATLPDRPHEMGDWQCDYCSWQQTCWTGYEKEITDLIQNAEFEGNITGPFLEPLFERIGAGGIGGVPKKYASLQGEMLKSTVGMPIDEICRRYLEVSNEAGMSDAEAQALKYIIKLFVTSQGASKGRAGDYTIHNQIQHYSYLNREKVPESILRMATEDRIKEVLQIRKPKK